MQAIKGKTIAKVIGYILVALLLAGVIGLVYRFTNGFNEDFKTFYVECDGKQILKEDTQMSLYTERTYRFDVKYTFDTSKSEPKGYNVKIVPHVEKDFDFTVDGEWYLYSKVGDLTPAFDLSKGDTYFELTTTSETSIQEVLSKCYPGKEVVVPDIAEESNPYPYTLVVSSYNDSVKYNIHLSIGVEVTGVELDQTHIIFTEKGVVSEVQGGQSDEGSGGQASTASYYIGYDTLGNGSNQSVLFTCQTTAKAGETVTFTVELVEQDELEITNIMLQNADTGDEIDGLVDADGVYSFVMPDCDVIVMVYLMTV